MQWKYILYLQIIEQIRFLSTVFLCSEFKLDNIFSGVNFCGKIVCGNFYLRELYFADRWKTISIEPTMANRVSAAFQMTRD